MYQVSEAFAVAMKSNPYIARITLDGVDTIQGEAVREIIFRGGGNADTNALTLGAAVACSVELTLDQAQITCAIENRELFVELGMELTAGTEWIPMGKYTARDPIADDGVLTVTALDALGTKLDVLYEVLDGFNFTEGVDSVALLEALCARRGVTVDTSGLKNISLQGSPEGFTERQIVGFISALYGGFAHIDRRGILKIERYTKADLHVTADDYYEDGLEKADYTFTAGWIKCFNPATELNMFLGNMDAPQGVRLESIWMPTSVFADLWEQMDGYAYRPVQSLSFMGDPRIDPGDIITLQDAAGDLVSVPVMTLTQEYDGGLRTTVAAPAQAVTEDRTGSTRQAILRSLDQAKGYTNSENEKLNQLELLKRLTKEWVDDGIYLTEDGKIGINASSVLVGVLDAALIQVINLIADHLRSVSGSSVMDVSGAVMNMDYDGMTTVHLSNEYGPLPILYMHDYVSGVRMDSCELSPHHIKVGGDSLRPLFVVERKDYINNTSGVQDAWSQLYAGSINPGKKILYTGSVSAGESFKLFESYTSRYDLFAIRLGTDSDKSPATVLAYKQGNTIYGVGGWCGTETLYKELYFVSITISGDTWTLVDAGLHDVYESGGLSDSTRLQLKEVIGVI